MEIISMLKTLHFANFCWLMILPPAMMALDVLTGLIGAWVHNNFQSAKMRSGLGKKAGELAVIIIGIIFTYGMALPEYLLSGVAGYIILMELMSVVENLDYLGTPLPAFVQKAINNVGEAIQHDELPELQKKIEAMEETIKLLQDEDDRK